MTQREANRLKDRMKERDDDNGGEPLNAVDKGYHLACTHFYEEIDRLVDAQNKDMPSLNPTEPKTGRWTRELIRNEYGGCMGGKMICSECGQDNGYDKRMKFCPNCGTKMEVEHE